MLTLRIEDLFTGVLVVSLKGCVMILSLFSRQLQVSNATVAPIGHKVSSEQSFNRQTNELSWIVDHHTHFINWQQKFVPQ